MAIFHERGLGDTMQALKIDRRLNTNSTKVARDSSFELLRIISMFFIAICHFATHGGFDFGAQTLTLPRFWWYFIEMGGNFGVDVFVLISGYFLLHQRMSYSTQIGFLSSGDRYSFILSQYM